MSKTMLSHMFIILVIANKQIHKIAALLWRKEATKVKFLVKEQYVSFISTDVNGIS